ncbi:unnamed protein product [uncultured bacterium]|nr:unnamed protein product [uncultured bacterium]
MKSQIFGFTLSILLCVAARGELKWEQTMIVLHPAASDKEAVGHFKYQNVGTEPIRFKSVHSSCGCTTAQSQKEEAAAGEQGEITATFKIGDRVGVQVKTVTVQTDDPTQSVTVLTLKAVLPELLEIKPTFVYWEEGEAPKPKTIIVRANKVLLVNQLNVSSSNPDFHAKVQPVSNGEFKIDIEPKQTMHAMVTTLTIHPDNLSKTFYANARVTKAPMAQ